MLDPTPYYENPPVSGAETGGFSYSLVREHMAYILNSIRNTEVSARMGRRADYFPFPGPNFLRVLILVAFAGHGARAAYAQSARIPSWKARGDEVVRVVIKNFYDERAANAWATRHRDLGAGANSDGEFAARCRQALAELRVSHTGYYTEDDPEYSALVAIYGATLNAGDTACESIGADVTPGGFVRTLFAGGPAADAGIRRGDRILAADGGVFNPVRSLRGHAEPSVSLRVQRVASGPSLPVTLRPRVIAPKQEWLAAQKEGGRIITRSGRRIAYVPLFACAGEEFENALKDQLGGPLATADALILDLRNGWGGCNPDFVNLFNSAPPVLTYTGRDGASQLLDTQWRKPLIVLIYGGSRSGKEALAYSIKKHRLGILVGAPTAGAVMSGRCFRLSSGALLLLAVADVRVDGERLEGRGVKPDVPVKDRLSFANGADPQLENALEVATKRLAHVLRKP